MESATTRRPLSPTDRISSRPKLVLLHANGTRGVTKYDDTPVVARPSQEKNK